MKMDSISALMPSDGSSIFASRCSRRSTICSPCFVGRIAARTSTGAPPM